VPYTSWMQSRNPGSPSGPGTGPQQQYTMNSGYQGGSQQSSWNSSAGYQSNPYGNAPQMQAQPTGRPFQPSSSFGQQLAGQISGGYGQPQVGYPSNQQYNSGYPSGYNPPQQQQQQQMAQYLSEFDPYAPPPTPLSPSSSSFGGGTTGGPYPQHPRQHVQQHKLELEAWDQYAWKQALNAFDALKDAWGTRKQDIENRAKSLGGTGLFGGGGYGGYGQAQELARLEALAKEAGSNFDSVAASTFQMKEVFSGYRQSGDIASKRRVRESINAALGNLPDWPPQAY